MPDRPRKTNQLWVEEVELRNVPDAPRTRKWCVAIRVSWSLCCLIYLHIGSSDDPPGNEKGYI